jgi:hypothetical protein
LTPAEVVQNLQVEIDKMESGLPINKEAIQIEFLVTSTIQEIAMANEWSAEYLALSAKVDELLLKIN